MGKWEIRTFSMDYVQSFIASPAETDRIRLREENNFQAVLDEGWEPYCVVKNRTFAIHYFKRYMEDSSE